MAESVGVLIVGGGPVGSALALALRDSDLEVVLLEAQTGRVRDSRPIALSYGSRLILERLGIWAALSDTATPIRRIHVSQRGGFGRAQLDADEAGLPDLGYVVDYGRLTLAFASAVSASTVHHIEGATVTEWHAGDPAQVSYTVDSESRISTAQLVVIADGGVAGDVDAVQSDYRQCAVTARVTSDRPHDHVAYERFTRTGPVALLPDADGWALVWTTTPAHAEMLCAVHATEFLSALQAEFGARTGRFVEVTGRARYPLRLRRARRPVQDHVVLIGNAAQTLHPVAGQGFNLGLRDAWELGEQLLHSSGVTVGSREWLAAYRSRRRLDRGGVLAFTHTLVQLFSNDLPPLSLVRGTGLALLGCIPPLKDFVVRRMTFGARG